MDTNVPPPVSGPASRRSSGLAIAALILGILAFFFSFLLVGALLGGLGVVLGAVHISRRRGSNGLAWSGMILSLVGIGLSVGLGVLYLKIVTGHKVDPMSVFSAAPRVEATDPQFADWVGKAVPDFTVTDLNGEKLQASALRGRRVVLDFWATWCPPCRMEIPHYIRLANETPPDELLIVGISSEDTKTLKRFVDKEGINYPIVSADNLPAPFDSISAIPTTFFVDRNGRIQNVVVGYHDYEALKKMALAEDQKVEAKKPADDQS